MNLKHIWIAVLMIIMTAQMGTAIGVVTITFDEGYAGQTVQSIHHNLSIPATKFVSISHVGLGAGYDTWYDITNMSTDYEIAAHSMSHNDLSVADSSNITYEVSESYNNLTNRGYNVTTFAYPGGSYRRDVLNITQNYYIGGRGATSSDVGNNWKTWSNSNEFLKDAQNLMRIKCNVLDTGNVTNIKDKINLSISSGEWVCLLWHNINSSGKTTLSDYNDAMEYLSSQRAAGNVSVLSFSDAINYYRTLNHVGSTYVLNNSMVDSMVFSPGNITPNQPSASYQWAWREENMRPIWDFRSEIITSPILNITGVNITNSIRNPSFEYNSTNFVSQFSNDTMTNVTFLWSDDAHDDSKSVHIQTGVISYWSFAQSNIPVIPNTTYGFSMWIKANKSFIINYYDGSYKSFISISQNIIDNENFSSEWKWVTGQFIPTTSPIWVRFYTASNYASYTIDSWILNKSIPSPIYVINGSEQKYGFSNITINGTTYNSSVLSDSIVLNQQLSGIVPISLIINGSRYLNYSLQGTLAASGKNVIFDNYSSVISSFNNPEITINSAVSISNISRGTKFIAGTTNYTLSHISTPINIRSDLNHIDFGAGGITVNPSLGSININITIYNSTLINFTATNSTAGQTMNITVNNDVFPVTNGHSYHIKKDGISQQTMVAYGNSISFTNIAVGSDYVIEEEAIIDSIAISKSNTCSGISSYIPIVIPLFGLALMIFSFGVIFFQLKFSSHPSPEVISISIIVSIVGFGMLLVGNYLIHSILNVTGC